MAMPPNVDRFLAGLRGTRHMVVAGGASLSPIILAFAGISPPWPPDIIKISTVIALFLAMANYHALMRGRSTSVRWRLNLSVIVVCLAFPIYLVVLKLFTFKIPTTGEVVILGCGYTENARLVATARHFDDGPGCPGSFERMLEGAQYNPYEIWGKLSLGIIPMIIVVLWLFVVAGIVIGMTSFAAPGPPKKVDSAKETPA